MTYTKDSKVKTPLQHREREMLLAGFSYTEIVQTLGVSLKALSSRNQIVYKINLFDAFARRVEREGVPCRLAVSDAFGYWFSGIFDGEGCLSVFSRQRPGRYAERRLGIQIVLRDDDFDVIRHIKDNLGVGIVYRQKGHGPTNPHGTFRVEQVQDLAEVVVLLFEKYPLYSKKRREFAVWKELVRTRYLLTLGGRSQRTCCTEEQNATFDAGREAIRRIRRYPGIALPVGVSGP